MLKKQTHQGFATPKNEGRDPLADITDEDIAKYAPTPGPEVGRNADKWLAGLVMGGIVLAIAAGGTKGIIDTIHNNPNSDNRNPPRAHI